MEGFGGPRAHGSPRCPARCMFLALRGRTKVRHMEPEHLGVLSPRGARSWPQGNGATLRLHDSGLMGMINRGCR